MPPPTNISDRSLPKFDANVNPEVAQGYAGGHPLLSLGIHLPTGLRGRLFLAFAGISSFAVLAAIAGLVTFVAARRPLEEITATRMPVTLGAMELMRHSERLVATGPALLNAANADEITAVTATEYVQLDSIRRHLVQLKDADPASPRIREIDLTIDNLTGNLADIENAVMRRDQAASYKQAFLHNAFRASQEFAKIWSVRFEQMQKQVIDLQRTTTSRQADPGKSVATIDSLDEAMQSILPLDQLQRRAADSFQLLVGGAETSDLVELARLKAAAEKAMSDIDGLVSGVDLDISTALLPAIKQLHEAALGDGGLFAVRETELKAGADSRRLIAENAQLSSRLSELVEGFVALSRQQMEAASRGAVAVQDTGALALAGIVVLSLACSVLIVWLYVGRNIVSRLAGISAGMAGIASGRRDVVVNTEGVDEIATMARTVEVFRQNAIERDTLLAERAEAAVQLEGKVEERTAELRESLDQQTATAEVLQVINSSPGDLIPVFDTVLEKALHLCGAAFGDLYTYDGERFRVVAVRGAPAEYVEHRIKNPPNPSVSGTVSARILVTKQPLQVLDLKAEEVYGSALASRRVLVDVAGARTQLAVPLLKDETVLGYITIYRREVQAFSEKQTALLHSFAAQAVIAMENARLITETRAARDAAEAALRELKAAQANLIQAEKMASLGQLTAGIAHEIKNPLNFVNNFASLSVELLDELKEATEPAVAALGEAKRAEVDETIGMLSGNLDKIAEHGKRADNIVKSMLEHSRGVTGERRQVDLNGLVDEALNLAYHGARAHDRTFNITLKHDYALTLKPIELAPREMTRVFLNLFGNGFYAANKRVPKNGDETFRPTLTVATRDLGDAVEVRVRDNGTGIPPEIKDKLFQPFFTTKPTGEGTGLGLSISYDIVTQQHGGTIEVDSQVGEFTEFTIRLPRGGAAQTAASA